MALKAEWIGNLNIPAATNPAWDQPWPEWATPENLVLMAKEAMAADQVRSEGKKRSHHSATILAFPAKGDAA